MSINIIELLGIGYKEDIISNLIVGLINNSEKFKKSFLQNIVGIDNCNEYNIKAFTRIATSKGIPDILIKIYNEQESILAVIENKLKAEEGYNQTARYSSEECIENLCANNKINLNYKDVDTRFIYLTLIPEQIPTGEKFVNRTYKDLLEKVNLDLEDEFLNNIYKDFLTHLNVFYNNVEVKEQNKLLELFSDNIDSEKKYVRFKNLMKLIEFDNGLEVMHIGKINGLGRSGFAAIISKDTWISKEKLEFIDEFYKVHSNVYNIHFEPSFELKNNLLKIPVHYETNPYIPKDRLIRKCKEEDYKKYIYRRNIFKDKLHEKIHNLGNRNIKPYNGSNQIASMNVTINSNDTVKDFSEKIKKSFNILSRLVEETLEETVY